MRGLAVPGPLDQEWLRCGLLEGAAGESGMGVKVLAGTDFVREVTGAGLVRIWETRRAYGSLAVGVGREAVRAQETALYEREFAELGEEQANLRDGQRQGARRLGEIFGQGHAPLWRVVSGLMQGMDLSHMHPNERAGRISRLIRAVERVVRYEWRAFEKKQNAEFADGRVQSAEDGVQKAESRRQSAEDGEGVESGDDACDAGAGGMDDPRVRWWDPMRIVCEHFGLAYSALSRFSREVAGLSASDLTDRVKAEQVKTRMREDVKAWVKAIYAEERAKAESELPAARGIEATEKLWALVAIRRGRGKWSRSAWAVKFGYSSYTRFQRACLAQYGISPVELERVVLEEIVESLESEMAVSPVTEDVAAATETPETKEDSAAAVDVVRRD